MNDKNKIRYVVNMMILSITYYNNSNGIFICSSS